MALNTKHVYLNKFYAHLAAAVTSGATSLTIYPEEITNLLAGWQASTWLYLCITDAEGNLEIVKMTGLSGTTLTVARGQGGTSAVAWNAGALVICRAVAENLDRILQKGVRRSGAYNPNDVLTGEYTGEKLYQTGPLTEQRRWWMNTDGTKWRLLAGDPFLNEEQDGDGYWHAWSWDDDFSVATINRERWHYESGMEISDGELCPPLVAAFYQGHERAMLEDTFDLYFTVEKNDGEEAYFYLNNDLTGAELLYVYFSINQFATYQIESTLGTVYASATDDPFPIDVNIYRVAGEIYVRWKSDGLSIDWTDVAGSVSGAVDLIARWRPRGYVTGLGMGLDDVYWDGALPGDFYHAFGDEHWIATTGAWNTDHWDDDTGVVLLTAKDGVFGAWQTDFRPVAFYVEFSGAATVVLTLRDSNGDTLYTNAAYTSGSIVTLTFGSYDIDEIEVSDAALSQVDNIMFMV